MHEPLLLLHASPPTQTVPQHAVAAPCLQIRLLVFALRCLCCWPMGGVQVTATDYLETALMPVPGTGPAVEAKNAIRYSIKNLFPDRDCATLVRPAHDEQVGHWEGQERDICRRMAAHATAASAAGLTTAVQQAGFGHVVASSCLTTCLLKQGHAMCSQPRVLCMLGRSTPSRRPLDLCPAPSTRPATGAGQPGACAARVAAPRVPRGRGQPGEHHLPQGHAQAHGRHGADGAHPGGADGGVRQGHQHGRRARHRHRLAGGWTHV